MYEFVTCFYEILSLFHRGNVYLIYGGQGTGRTTFLYYLMAAASLQMPVVYLHHGHQYDRHQQADFLRLWPEVKGYSYRDIEVEDAVWQARNGLLGVHNIHTLPYSSWVPQAFTPEPCWHLDWQLRIKIAKLRHPDIITITIADVPEIPDVDELIRLTSFTERYRRYIRVEIRGHIYKMPFLPSYPPREWFDRGTSSAMAELCS